LGASPGLSGGVAVPSAGNGTSSEWWPLSQHPDDGVRAVHRRAVRRVARNADATLDSAVPGWFVS